MKNSTFWNDWLLYKEEVELNGRHQSPKPKVKFVRISPKRTYDEKLNLLLTWCAATLAGTLILACLIRFT